MASMFSRPATDSMIGAMKMLSSEAATYSSHPSLEYPAPRTTGQVPRTPRGGRRVAATTASSSSGALRVRDDESLDVDVQESLHDGRRRVPQPREDPDAGGLRGPNVVEHGQGSIGVCSQSMTTKS